MIDFLKLLKEKELSIVLEGYDVQTCNRVKVSESKNILYQMLTMSDIIRQEFPGMHGNFCSLFFLFMYVALCFVG